MVVCAAFGLTVSEARCTIKRTSSYIWGNLNHKNTDLSMEVDRHIRNEWYSFWKYTLDLYGRPSAPLELKIRMLRAEVRLRHVEPAHVPIRDAATSPPQLSDSLQRSAREQPHRPPDFLPGHPHEDRK